ncbi:hypothetical protein O0I10_003675 [Lichtheimia ornata]|uniref:Uncharacterized protein n=1 Tax=Lichtheimia ornata TaxID=688661 RepID=A0AAD7V7X3_9FUNG|nr:uncharacterized protein O0I10_003675 [Lichtheimia ornata]KAJ8660627.1 hypothetical protein O0I10_003675 [Lichtheimia ornata]
MPRLIVDDATLSDDGKWGAASTLNIPLEGSRHMIQIDKVGGCGKGIHEDRTWRFGYVTIVNGYGSFQENKNVEINHEHQEPRPTSLVIECTAAVLST